MSLKKEVHTRTETYTIYSSEMQERMRVYFDLTQEYNQCIEKCPTFDKESEAQCEKVCSAVYDKYALLLKERYEKNPEKLKEVVTNAKGFETKKREHTSGLFYRVFGFTLDGSDSTPADQKEFK